MQKRIFLYFIVTLLFMDQNYLSASDFRIHELGAKAATLGGAFVARADNSSAVFYNPAGIAFLNGIQLRLNMNFFNQKTISTFEDEDSSFLSSPGKILGFCYFSWRLMDKLSFGIGAFVPYSFEVSWPQWWKGSAQSIAANLIVYDVRPALGLRLSDRLAVGVGLDIVRANVTWDHHEIFRLPKVNPELQKNVFSSFDVNGTGLSFSAGLLLKARKNLQMGGKYQHKAEIDLKGSNFFLFQLAAGSEDVVLGHDGASFPLIFLMNDFYKPQRVTSRMTLPSEVLFGFMYAPFSKIILQMDIQWTQWSTTKKWEFVSENSDENLNPEFVNNYGDFYGIRPDYFKRDIDLNWKDTWNMKLGAEYCLSKHLSLRAGFANHQSPMDVNSRNPVYPAFNRKIYALGVGYEGPMFSLWDGRRLGILSFDAFLQYVSSDRTASSLSGEAVTYDSNFWIFGFGVGLSWGKEPSTN